MTIEVAEMYFKYFMKFFVNLKIILSQYITSLNYQ